MDDEVQALVAEQIAYTAPTPSTTTSPTSARTGTVASRSCRSPGTSWSWPAAPATGPPAGRPRPLGDRAGRRTRGAGRGPSARAGAAGRVPPDRRVHLAAVTPLQHGVLRLLADPRAPRPGSPPSGPWSAGP